ncbi:MAG: ribose-phosphate diphosphokinase [Pseudomonadales bacterium]
MRLLAFPDYEAQSRALAKALDVPCDVVNVHRFPDGESRLRLPAILSGEVILCRSLDDPNAKLVELMLAAEGARVLGAARLTLVAPYLCYMRQDTAFATGDVVSQKVIGRFLADHFDQVITVDPHLHRVATLAEAVPAERSVAVSAAPAMGDFLAARGQRPLLVGPDRESRQWVQIVAERAGLDYVVASKTRHDDRRVEITLPPTDYAKRSVVLVDDLASTGHTLAEAARALTDAGALRVDVLVTHALFVGDALEIMRRAGIGEVWSSDSVTHASNAFPLAATLAAAVR